MTSSSHQNIPEVQKVLISYVFIYKTYFYFLGMLTVLDDRHLCEKPDVVLVTYQVTLMKQRPKHENTVNVWFVIQHINYMTKFLTTEKAAEI